MKINWHRRRCNAHGALLSNMLRFNITYISVSKKTYTWLNCKRVSIGMIEDNAGRYVALGIKPILDKDAGGEGYVLYRTPENSSSQVIKICAGSFIRKHGLAKSGVSAVFTGKTMKDTDGAKVFVFDLLSKDGSPTTLEKEKGDGNE